MSRTVVLGDRPPELETWLARRRGLGQDLYDEMWEGDYHVNPTPHSRHGQTDFALAVILAPLAAARGLRGSGPCTIGRPDNYRVPDQAYVTADTPLTTYLPSAAVVVEVVSPGDESRAKLDFYASARVDEVFIVDPDQRSVEIYQRAGDYVQTNTSGLLGYTASELVDALPWP